ncbi:NACHT, LRR and PYD domains-containing protein 3 [Sticta canariensis]|nr:NACHT, LRR and PYD domains-containing protein 3 [Sticta canariensis]
MTSLAGSPDKAASKPWDEYSDSSNHSDSNKLGDPFTDSSTQQPKDEDTSDPSNHSDSEKLGDSIFDSSTQQQKGNLLGNSSPSSHAGEGSEKSAVRWRPSTSDPIKWDEKIDHSTTNWRECFNHYCQAHLPAKQDNGYFPKPKEYNSSKTHPRADASTASSTTQPNVTQTTPVAHDSLSWTICYNNHCQAHLAAKKDWGWFPRKARHPRADASPASSTPQPNVTQTTPVTHDSLSWTICYNDHCQGHLSAKKDWGWFPRKARYVHGRQNNSQQNKNRPNNGQQNMGPQNNDRQNNGQQNIGPQNNNRQKNARQNNGQQNMGLQNMGLQNNNRQNNERENNGRQNGGRQNIGPQNNNRQNYDRQNDGRQYNGQTYIGQKYNHGRHHNGQTYIGQKYNHGRHHNGQTYIGQKYNVPKKPAEQTTTAAQQTKS